MGRVSVYSLLRGPEGERLRAIATSGGQSHRTAKAIDWLGANFDKSLRVQEQLSRDFRNETRHWEQIVDYCIGR